ncbi:MAG TPA: hypothetical protein PLF42_15880, partial [Anaerolineales bacterium]|nr:hypothetical protein [Anaerolineales bacterium]
MDQKITIGMPRMYAEYSERRDFLPNFVARLIKLGADVSLEHGYGAGMGLTEEAYLQAAPQVNFVSHDDAYNQSIVIILRCPVEEDLRRLKPGACLISMLHYPTRPDRVELLHSLGIEAISLDSLTDDNGRRLIENLRSVAWNGLEVGFQVLRRTYPAPG